MGGGKLSVFENGQFSGHFFLDQKFKKKCKMLWGKSFGIFLTLKKKFFSGHFFSKKIQKKFGKFFKGKKFFKMFFYFFFKKSVLKKKHFLSVKKIPKLFPHNILHFFLNFWSKKKVSAKLSVFKNADSPPPRYLFSMRNCELLATTVIYSCAEGNKKLWG